ncbi:hypothetical protein PR048_005616 [Dryococelus australis]|uniref:Integrase catalytic domain-containing protein n=1 Tax=Dryococelus australis TaxID=614101 RepID=A0ABQ9I9W5_9NEOP|nr:hypothetical protein PR048_005616 [Dryococelus australis]
MQIKGTHYLVIYDYFSRYLDAVHMDRLTTDAVIKRWQNIFSRHGILETIRNYGISHITSIPKFLQSNGAAESAVAVVNNILIKSQDPNLWLLAYLATPLESGFSPAELLFGCKL